MLCTLGDLLDDVIVWVSAPVGGRAGEGTDTPARVFHRRGGSAANVAAFAAHQGQPARFIGQIGDDPLGERLVGELADEGVDVRVRRGGRTGSVVVLVEPGGERTMLTDRGSATDLADVPDAWLDGVGLLHLTAYALAVEPMAATAMRLAATARAKGGLLSLDASSVRLLHDLGSRRVAALLAALRPDVLLANGAEADLLDLPGELPDGVSLAVVKRGGEPAVVVRPGQKPVVVPALPIGAVADTTGAGDAFAAGFLGVFLHGGDPIDAVSAGHSLAAAVLPQPGASLAGERC